MLLGVFLTLCGEVSTKLMRVRQPMRPRTSPFSSAAAESWANLMVAIVTPAISVTRGRIEDKTRTIEIGRVEAAVVVWRIVASVVGRWIGATIVGGWRWSRGRIALD